MRTAERQTRRKAANTPSASLSYTLFAERGYLEPAQLTPGYRDRILHDKTAFQAAFDAGAKVYICGSPNLADGVKLAIVKLWAQMHGKSEEEAWEWMRGDGWDRFATDVFI